MHADVHSLIASNRVSTLYFTYKLFVLAPAVSRYKSAGRHQEQELFAESSGGIRRGGRATIARKDTHIKQQADLQPTYFLEQF